MAAPKTAYKNTSLFRGNIEHLIAILQISEATHKSRFYLDGYISVMTPDGKGGVVGYVALGSANANMHNLVRRGGGLRSLQGGQVVQLLNDGGLNTYGKAVINNVELEWANNVRIDISYLSAWYLDSTQIGVRFRKVGTSTWFTDWIVNGFVAKQNSLNRKTLFDSLNERGDQIEVQGVIVNGEGTWESSSKIINLKDKIYKYDAFKRTSACAESGQVQIDFWITETSVDLLPNVTTTSGNTGVFVWQNIEATLAVANGWLFGFDGNKSFEVVGGQITRYQDCTPSFPTAYVDAEMDFLTGNYKVHVNLTSTYSASVVVSGRIDISSNSTPFGKTFSITIPSGQTSGESQNFDLSDNTYQFYNVGATPAGVQLIVQSGNIN